MFTISRCGNADGGLDVTEEGFLANGEIECRVQRCFRLRILYHAGLEQID